jgi:predicted RNA-binding Zn ribbon-like protein
MKISFVYYFIKISYNNHMMNKRPLVNFCLLLLLIGLGGFFFAPMARAETSAACQSFVADTTPVSEAGGTTAAGITPANTVYFLDKFGDWIKLRLFSFTQDSKINTLLDQAQERVGELEDLAEQNNLKVAYVNSIISSYNGIMAEVDERLAGLVSNGNDVEDILERIVKISAKNQLVVATLLTNVAADNYNKIYSAYNNTSDNFCTSVGAWVNRVNQCSDAVVMYQELNNNYANIVATINEAANNFADLSAGYQAASIYQEKLVALQDYLETYINGLIYYLGDSDGSVADKTYHLQNFLNSITTDSNYVEVLASQPGLIVDDTGADSSAADRGLIASLSFLQKLTAGLGGYDSPLSFALAFKTNEVNGLTGEIKQLDSLIANRRSRIAYLKDSQETCAGLEKSYRKVITNLRTNKLSKAKDLIDDIWSSLNTLDESYLTGCGLSETIKFLHNVSQNGDLFSDSNCTNSSYASELATWASQQSMVWEMMDSFHDQLINVYQAEINTYQAIRTVRASLLSAANNDLALMMMLIPMIIQI